jgi:putative ABC transport system substrate-binding protein
MHIGSRIRNIVAVIAIALAILASAHLVGAQQARAHRIGFISSASSSAMAARNEAFRQGLRALGYIVGENITIEYRWADGKNERLPGFAADLVNLKLDVIVTHGGVATRAVQQASTTIPIVIAAADDPLAAGLVASLARPGGNITGYMEISPELSGKRLQLLKETFPSRSRVAILWSPATPDTALQLRETEAAAHALGLQLRSQEVRGSEDFQSAYAAMGKDRVDAVIIIQNSVTLFHRRQLLELATKDRLPTICEAAEFARDGCLIAYESARAYMLRRGAIYVDKILKGEAGRSPRRAAHEVRAGD